MKCKHAKQLISPYMDGELEGAETEQLLAHIKTCEACKQELEETKELSRMFASVERASAPNGFVTKVLAGVAVEEGFRHRLANIFKPVFIRATEAAFACVIVFIGIISGSMLIQDKAEQLSAAEMKAVFYLDVFESAPPDSIAGVYVAMTGVKNEK